MKLTLVIVGKIEDIGECLELLSQEIKEGKIPSNACGGASGAEYDFSFTDEREVHKSNPNALVVNPYLHVE